jgi:Mrp family chromosome partitioning ATPase
MVTTSERNRAAKEDRQYALPALSGNVRSLELDRNLILTEELAEIPKEYTTLTQRLFLSPASGQPGVVVFTGVDSRADSSAVCANVARLLAFQTGMSVCLVDINNQRPNMPCVDGVNAAGPGLTDALARPGRVREVACNLSGTLWCLSSNRPSEETLPLVTSAKVGELAARIRSEFRYALIACPPVVSEPASIPICIAGDATVLVIGSKSKRTPAFEAMKLLTSMKIQLAGAVHEQPRR